MNKNCIINLFDGNDKMLNENLSRNKIALMIEFDNKMRIDILKSINNKCQKVTYPYLE